MSRGLSPEQRALLGLACAVNRATQNGVLATKPGKPVDGYRYPAIECRAARDLSWRLALWATTGLLPDRQSGVYHNVPELMVVKASVSRTLRRLQQRRLIVLAAVPMTKMFGYLCSALPLSTDYLLTDVGIEAGAAHECWREQLDVALEAFGMVLPPPGGDSFDMAREMERKALQRLYPGGHELSVKTLFVSSEY